MVKIINGKKYSTETAKELASYSTPDGWNDFRHTEETLFQKRTGEFFLYGEGGGLSRYARREYDGLTRGEDIVPLTYEDAQEWAEKCLDADDYEAIFGEVEEDDSRKTITVNLATSTVEAAKRLASQRATSLSAIIEELLLQELGK